MTGVIGEGATDPVLPGTTGYEAIVAGGGRDIRVDRTIDRAGRRLRPQHIVAVVYVAAQFMSVMDASVVNVALPTLAREFHAATASVQWVVLGYLLSLAIWIPASGWLGDRFGTKRVFLLALAFFVVASAMCGTATSLEALVAYRIVQGIGGGMLLPVGIAMLFRTFPPEARARVARIVMVPALLAPASGPLLGGLLIVRLTWRAIFFVNVPVGIAALAFGLLLSEHKEHASDRFDTVGFVTSGAGLALVLYALTEGPVQGWSAPLIVGALSAGAALLVSMVVAELRRSRPMLDLSLLADRMFRRANMTMAFGISGFIGLMFVVPLYLQEARGLSALGSGLASFPEALGILTGSQIVGRLYRRVGPRRLLLGGLLAMTCCIVLMAQMSLGVDLWWFRLAIYGLGIGMGFVSLSLQAAMFATIGRSDMGRASALYITQRQVASALGVAILATVLSSGVVATTTPSLGAFQDAFLASAALVFCGAASALRVRDSDAAATMAGRRS